MNFIEFVTRKAGACGWKISEIITDDLVVIAFSEESGAEKVFLRPCGKTPDGHTVIEFTSQGLPVASDTDLARDVAFSLLRRNGEMLMGHWGIERIGDREFFTVFVTMIANTMDTDEFSGAVAAILSERRLVAKSMQSAAIEF